MVALNVIFVVGSKVTSYVETNIKDAKALVSGVDKVEMISIRFWDGSHVVQINRFPKSIFGKSCWTAYEITFDQEGKDKNAKFLEKFKKSGYPQ
jgi:hypothetical protein